jgi:hypothetical protein
MLGTGVAITRAMDLMKKMVEEIAMRNKIRTG